jgi:hypothetical protein
MNELIARATRIKFATRTCTPWMILLGFLCVHTLGGCGGGGGIPSTPSTKSVPPMAAADARQGRYVGTVKIGGVDYYGDALITADGLIRMYIGGPYTSDGTVQPAIPTASGQLYGPMAQPTDGPRTERTLFSARDVLPP